MILTTHIKQLQEQCRRSGAEALWQKRLGRLEKKLASAETEWAKAIQKNRDERTAALDLLKKLTEEKKQRKWIGRAVAVLSAFFSTPIAAAASMPALDLGEISGKSALLVIRQLKEHISKLDKEYEEMSDQSCRELKQLRKMLGKLVAKSEKRKAKRKKEREKAKGEKERK